MSHQAARLLQTDDESYTFDEFVATLFRSAPLVRKLFDAETSTLSIVNAACYLSNIVTLRRIIYPLTTPVNPTISKQFMLFLHDVPHVVSTILDEACHNSNGPKTSTSMLNACSEICGRVYGMEDPHCQYASWGVREHRKFAKLQDDIIKREMQNKNWVSWEQVMTMQPEMHKLGAWEELMYQVYTNLPPRRLQEYQTLRLRIQNPNELIPLEGNWVLVTPRNIATDGALSPVGPAYALCLNLYKTKGFHGTYTVKFDDEVNASLIKAFARFFRKNPRKDAQLIFMSETGKEISSGNFSRRVADIFRNALHMQYHRVVPLPTSARVTSETQMILDYDGILQPVETLSGPVTMEVDEVIDVTESKDVMSIKAVHTVPIRVTWFPHPSVNILRQSFITWAHQQPQYASIDAKKDLAVKMGHSGNMTKIQFRKLPGF
jgi:hypothetical protein